VRGRRPFLVHTINARRILSGAVNKCADGRMAFYHHYSLFKHLEFLGKQFLLLLHLDDALGSFFESRLMVCEVRSALTCYSSELLVVPSLFLVGFS
jgi:hypothetical protein